MPEYVREYWFKYGAPALVSAVFTILVWTYFLGGRIKELEIAYNHALQAQQCMALLDDLRSQLAHKADREYVDAQIRLLILRRYGFSSNDLNTSGGGP